MARDLLKSSLENASFNIIFQVVLRCVTFVLNAFVLRYVSQDVVGVMNVRLLLLESTILFLSREAFRRACLSQSGSHSWPQIINLLWLTVPLSILISLVFSLVWLFGISIPSADITPHYTLGVVSMAVSCVIEMLSEPLYLVAQVFLFIRLQVVMSSITVIIRTLTFVPWIMRWPHQAVVAFSAAQVIANTMYCLGYYIYFYFYIEKNNRLRKEAIIQKMSDVMTTPSSVPNISTSSSTPESETVKDNGSPGKPSVLQRQNSMIGFDEPFPFTSIQDFLPSKVTTGEHWIHPNSALLTWSFLKQGVLKQVLTEGERYVMTLFTIMTFKEQGVYDVVNNLGSLAARFLFRPVEDASYFYFSQSVRRDVTIKAQNQDRMREAALVLNQVIHCITSVGLIIVVFGQNYSSLLLYLYGGESLSSGQGPGLLRAHCLSVLLLALNGVTECYTFATMTSQQLDQYNYLMALFSVLFLFISWALTLWLGGLGFIVANCCNMGARIAHSLWFIHGRYKDTDFAPLQGVTPKTGFLAALLVSFIATKVSEVHFSSLVHFGVGCGFGVITLITWCSLEKELVELAFYKWRTKQSKTE